MCWQFLQIYDFMVMTNFVQISEYFQNTAIYMFLAGFFLIQDYTEHAAYIPKRPRDSIYSIIFVSSVSPCGALGIQIRNSGPNLFRPVRTEIRPNNDPSIFCSVTIHQSPTKFAFLVLLSRGMQQPAQLTYPVHGPTVELLVGKDLERYGVLVPVSLHSFQGVVPITGDAFV